MTEPPDAAKIAGLLAHEDRRRAFAALVLGAATLDDVMERSGLHQRAAIEALARLTSGGLVVRGSDGSLALVGAAFAEAARVASPPEPLPVDETERVIATFVRDGRLVSLPTQRAKRLVILDLIAQDFEPGLRYSEEDVNALVGRWDDDHAALRRWLVDEAFLSRDAGIYWRSGGSVDLTHAHADET